MPYKFNVTLVCDECGKEAEGFAVKPITSAFAAVLGGGEGFTFQGHEGWKEVGYILPNALACSPECAALLLAEDKADRKRSEAERMAALPVSGDKPGVSGR